MKKIKQWYKNLRFRNKVLISHIAVSLVPVIILGVFCYGQTRKQLIEREKEVLEESLHQGISGLDNTLNSYKNFMDSLVWNDSLKQALNETYESNLQMYIAYRDIIDPTIQNINRLNPSIESVTIYGSNETLYPHGTNFMPLSEITVDMNFLKDSRIYWLAQKPDSLDMYCKIYSRDKAEQNIVHMGVNYKNTFGFLEGIFEDDFGILIEDKEGNPVFSYLTPKEGNVQETAEEIRGEKKYVVKETDLDMCDWDILLYRPVKAISASARSITALILTVICLCIGLIIIFSFLLAGSVVKPLGILVKNIQQVEHGKLEADIKEESNDEIGHLIRSFRKMVNRLDYMVNEVYQSKIMQQEYEMKALQAQINPHFLYNSLSLINWKAIMAEQEEISEMAQLLSTFYRTTLNKGKNVTTVKGEWDNTCSYCKIQSIMHSEKIKMDMQIDENILKYEMLNLLLQPLVENAIIHGLDHKETEGEKNLKISAYESGDNLIFEILDNGCGMSEEVLENILTAETKGYGVQNVHHRVQLYYGQNYGLLYKSRLKEGTQVQLKIPKNKDNGGKD